MQITFTARAPYVDVFDFISHRRQQQTESSAGLYKTSFIANLFKLFQIFFFFFK